MRPWLLLAMGALALLLVHLTRSNLSQIQRGQGVSRVAPDNVAAAAATYQRDEAARSIRGRAFAALVEAIDRILAQEHFDQARIRELCGAPDAVAPWGRDVEWVYFYHEAGSGAAVFLFEEGGGLKEISFPPASWVRRLLTTAPAETLPQAP